MKSSPETARNFEVYEREMIFNQFNIIYFSNELEKNRKVQITHSRVSQFFLMN
jgi:hypothetical protein